MPVWSLSVLGVFFSGPILVSEFASGSDQGAAAALAGVVVGLVIAWAAVKRRWDLLSVVATAVASHLLLGSPAALRETAHWGMASAPRTA